MAGRRLTYHGSLRKRGAESWEWRVSIDGTRHSETIRARTKTKAASIANTRYKILTGQVRKRRLGVPVDWTWEDYSADVEAHVLPDVGERTQAEYRRVMRRFGDYLDRHHPGIKVSELSKLHITAYLDWRKRNNLRRVTHAPKPEGVSPRTLAKDRTQLHTILKRAITLDILTVNPVEHVDAIQVEEREPVLLSEDELERVISEARSDMVRVYVTALAESGGRCGSEVLWLRWEDIDWDGGEHGFVRVWDDPQGHRTKTRRSRWIPMTRRLASVLREHQLRYRGALYGGKPSPWVFHHTATRRHAKAGERIKSLYRSFKAAAERAGIQADLHQHDLRHLRITTWVREGKPLAAVQKAAGHSTITTTERYTHLVRDDLTVLVEESESTITMGQLRRLTEVAPPEVRAAAATLIRYLTPAEHRSVK